MGDKVTVPRADIEAAIEDVCLGCYETAVKHLGAMLAADSGGGDEWTPLKYATQLAVHTANKHFPSNPDWQPLTDLMGVLSQIDNMLTAWDAPAEPVAWQYRLIDPSGPTKWRECDEAVRAMIAETGHYNGVREVPAELRPLYAAPSLR